MLGFSGNTLLARGYFLIIGFELIASGIIHIHFVSSILLPAAILITSFVFILLQKQKVVVNH
jgi:hypothetical protein